MKTLQKIIYRNALSLLLLIPFYTWAQDIHYSQFYETSILRNPALTGVFNGDYRVSMIYRNQWNSISAPFQTAQAALECKKQIGESQDFIGFGVLGFYDKTGSINLRTLSGSVAISYNKSINEAHNSFLSLGLMGGYIQRSFDVSKMTFDNQYGPGGYNPGNPTGESFGNPKVSQMDFGAGINYSTNNGPENANNYMIGFSAYHLTRPENTFYSDNAGIKKDLRWNLNASTNRLINEMWSVQFQGNFSLQGNYNETILGGLVGRKNDEAASESVLIFYAGCFYRIGDALIPVVKVDYNQLTFAASYDMNVSKLKAASNLRGGFEISIIKTGILNDPQKGFSKTVCPRR
jgi:type IX secretion system PorP/SprF family membrane protein